MADADHPRNEASQPSAAETVTDPSSAEPAADAASQSYEMFRPDGNDFIRVRAHWHHA